MYEGHVIGTCIKHIPLAGRDITAFVHQLMRDRKETVPPEQAREVARIVKEQVRIIPLLLISISILKYNWIVPILVFHVSYITEYFTNIICMFN